MRAGFGENKELEVIRNKLSITVYYLCVCVCVFLCVFVHHMGTGTHGGQKRTLDLRTDATGNCELPDVSARNQTRVLWKSSKYSYLLKQLSSLKNFLF